MNLTLTYLVFLISTGIFAQVGIGTTAPTATLDIDGNLRVQSIPEEISVESVKDSVLIVNDGFVKTVSALDLVDKSLPTLVKGSFSGSGLVNLSLSTGTQTIPFDNEELDNNDEFDLTTYTFTAKQDGVYMVKVQIEADATIGIANKFGVMIVKNAIVENRSSYANIGVAGVNVTPPVRTTDTVVQLNTGETLSFQIEGDIALGSVDLLGDSEDSFFSIHQVK
ncbi:MAG: hypothetical protein HKN48_09885 [Flavobacteriaceae bacterium]|nr:hypothetical protein [Flavobacteriaceae bacterium]